MLQYPWERPLTEPPVFSDYNPPTIPQIQTPIEYNQVLPMLVSRIANHLGEKARSNPARTYLFNACISNNWNNPYFTELVWFTVWFLYLQQAKQYCNNPEECINTFLDKPIALYVSKILMEEPELQKYVDYKTLEAGKGGYSQYQQVIVEINNLLNSPQPSQGANMYYQTQPMNQQHMQNQMPQQQAMYHQQMMNNRQYMQQPMYNPTAGMQAPMAGYTPMAGTQYNTGMGGPATPTTNRWDNPPQNPPTKQPEEQNNPTVTTISTEENTKETLLDNLIKKPGAEYIPLIIKGQVLKPIIHNNILDWEIVEENPMDRDRHTIVRNTIEHNTPVRVKNIEKQAKNIEMIDPDDVANVIKGNKDKVKDRDLKDIESTVYDGIIVESSLDEFIALAKIKSIGKLINKPDIATLYRVFGTVVSPVIVETEVNMDNSVVSRISDLCRDLDDVVDFIMKEISSTGVKNNPYIGYYNELDKVMTDMVNNYMGKSLLLSINIDSFINDWKDLTKYVMEEYGPSIADKLIKWSRYITKRMFVNIGGDVKKHLFGDYMEEVPNGYGIDTIDISYSITFLGLYDEELMMENIPNTGDPRQVYASTTPMLYNICKSVLDEGDQLEECQPVINLLMTADGVIYEIIQGALNPDAVLIARYK